MSSLKNFLTICGCLLVGLIVVLVFSKFVPFNMDEFTMYHTIMCHHYKYNMLNGYVENCRGYDLNFLNTGIILPLREYNYMGSVTSLYYYPLFLFWKSPLSARFMGMIFLALQALILSKIFRIRFWYIFLGFVAFFPYFFQHIVDTGVVGAQITCFFLIYYLLLKWFEKFEIKYAVFISILIFIGIWAKLTFLWFLPPIAIAYLICVVESRRAVFHNAKKFFPQSIFILILLAGLVSLLLFSTAPCCPNDRPYINQLKTGSYKINEYLNLIFSPEFFTRSVIQNLWNPLEATQRIYWVTAPGTIAHLYNLFIYASVPMFFILTLLVGSRSFASDKIVKTSLLKSVVFYISGILMVVSMLYSWMSGKMHHTILAFPLLIISFLWAIVALRKTMKSRYIKYVLACWFVIFVILNSYFFTVFHSQAIRNHDDFSKVYIHDYILSDDYLAKNYFYITDSWGIYYYQALYGPEDQSVLWMNPIINQAHINELQRLLKEHSRKILFLYNTGVPTGYDSNRTLIQETFKTARCGLIEDNSTWQILIQEDNNSENICFKKENIN